MLLLLHFMASSIMVGVIWVIQLVHYPSFNYVEKQRYSNFQSFHMMRISYVVIPVMLAELLTLVLLIYTMDEIEIALVLSGTILLMIWFITAIFFSGAHQKLTLGYDKSVVRDLIKMNWSRTLLWTFRLILLVACF
tara:strand:+ start:710 stop:1117 length:408 start_codon:yes stop_codon:yes gene_type:complete